MKFRLFGITDVGRARDHNEDNFVICKDLSEDAWKFDRNEIRELSDKGTVLVVADGMGGTNAGEIASDLAQKSIRSQFEQLDEIPGNDREILDMLNGFILNAHDQIVQYQQEHLDTAGMGTTLVIAWILNDKLYTSWSGDSRCYVFNPHTALYPLTDDHSHVWEMVKNNHLTPEQARTHPESNLISQNLGDTNQKPKPEGKVRKLNSGERVLVCSDGLNGMISDAAIHYVLVDEKSTPEACKRLVEKAKQAGGHDNITVLLLDVDPDEKSVAPPPSNEIESTVVNKQDQSKTSWVTLLLGLLLILAVGTAFYFWSDTDVSEVQKAAIFTLHTNTITINGDQPTEITPASLLLPSGPEITKVVIAEKPARGTASQEGNKILYTANNATGAFTDQLKVEMHGPSNSVFTGVFQLTRKSPEKSSSEKRTNEKKQTEPDDNKKATEKDIGQQSTPVPESSEPDPDNASGNKDIDESGNNDVDSTGVNTRKSMPAEDTSKTLTPPDTTSPKKR